MMRNKSESLLVPRRTCMWNAPDPPFNWPEAYASWGLSAKLPLGLRELAGGAIVFGSFLRFGAVAQLGEHHVCNVGVAGSSPVGSSFFFSHHFFAPPRRTQRTQRGIYFSCGAG